MEASAETGHWNKKKIKNIPRKILTDLAFTCEMSKITLKTPK